MLQATETPRADLVVHAGGRVVTLEELHGIATPPATDTWQPVPHVDLIAFVKDALAARGIVVKREEYAVMGPTSAKLFGVMDLAWGEDGEGAAALGLRTANDRSMAHRMAVGKRIFVCDNMAFSSELIAMRKKHTPGLDLGYEVNEAVARFTAQYGEFQAQIDRWRQTAVSGDDFKRLVCDAVLRGVIPSRLLRPIAERFFDGDDRSAWGAHNAFTFEMKRMGMARKWEATVELPLLLAS